MITKAATQNNFQSGKIFSSIITAVILGALEITFVLAYAALIFPTEISSHFNQGIAILLLGTIICFAILALFSSYAGCIGSAQDIPASIVAVMAIAILAALGDDTDSFSIFSTVIASMALASLLSAVLLLIIAFTGLGKAIRFIPYPIIGGLLISTGWILAKAGLSMMPDQWMIGAIFAISLLLLRKYISSPWVLPLFLLVTIIAINIYLKITGVSIEQARVDGYLLNVDLNQIPFVFTPREIFNSADWQIVLQQLPTIISLCLITCVIVLIQISSIEVVVKQEMQPKRELYATGFANVLVAFCCGLISYHHISSTTLAYNMGAQTRLVGLLTALICLLVFFTNTGWMEYLPLPILAGLILYLGLEFIYEWLIQAYNKIPKAEYLIMLLIVACAIIINFPAAILLGVICGFLLFAFQYNTVGIVKTTVTGDNCQSTVVRSSKEDDFLHKYGTPIAAFKLNGMLYFGTANALFERTKRFIDNEADQRLEFMVFDFEEISNIDSTALMNLLRTHEFLEKNNVRLLYSSLDDQQISLIKTFYKDNKLNSNLFFAQTLDHAIEESENRLLKQAGLYDEWQVNSLEAVLTNEDWNIDEITSLKPYLERITLQNHQALIRINENEDDVFLVISGRVNIVANDEKGNTKRLRVLKPGMIIGEMSLYTGLPRTADVIANGIATVHKISSAKIAELQKENPLLAIKLHRFFAKQMANRLIDEAKLQPIRSN